MDNSKAANDILCRAQHSKSLFTKALFERPQSLPSLLPYDEYLANHEVFVMKDGSLGAVFELNLLEHEVMTEQETLQKVANLKTWLTLPENCTLQIFFEQTEISERDKVFDDLRNFASDPHPLSKRLFEEKIDAFQGAAGKSQELSPMQRRCYISIRYRTKGKKKIAVPSLFERDEHLLHGEMKQFVRDLRRFQQVLKDVTASSQLSIKRLGGDGLVEILRRFFNPKTFYKRDFAKFNPERPISDQFLYNSPVLDCTGIEREAVKTKTLSLKTSPQIAFPGGMAYFTQLPFPFRLSLCFSFPSREKVKRFFDLKEFFLQNTPSARSKVQREEILEIQDRLARDDRIVNLTFNVIVEGANDEELDMRVRQICNVFNNQLECEVINEEDIGLGLCLNSMPLCYSPEADLSSQRAIRILKSDAINFFPIFDSFGGTRTPVSVFLSRENNLVPFSLLDNETSNHTVVAADTGAGKSAFINDWIQSCKRLSPEPTVFVLDKKSSYAMLSEYYDGDLSVFERSKEVPFNPFRGVYDEEKVAFLTKLLLTSIQLTSPSTVIESEHQAAVSKAIKTAYLKKTNLNGLRYLDGELLKGGEEANVELSMEDVVTELGALEATPKDLIEMLVVKLTPFYHDGIYAHFFKSSHKSEKVNRFYVYDLDALDSDPVLQTLMTMSIFEEIRRIMALPENMGRQSFLVFEEFARQGKNNTQFAEFAIDFAETMRKRAGWLITLTPRPQNYFETEIGRAFWGVADNFIFLQMNSDSVDYIAKHSSILDEASTEIVRSLRTVKGKYAEVFYTNKKKTCAGAFRSWMFPTARWMSPTNALDAQKALDALSSHKNKWDALDALVRDSANHA